MAEYGRPAARAGGIVTAVWSIVNAADKMNNG
jgi:hypothetical protein